MKTNRRSMIEINERYISHPDFSRELSFRLVLKSFVTIILLYREIPRGSTRRNSSDTPRSGIRLLFLFFFFKLSLTNFFNNLPNILIQFHSFVPRTLDLRSTESTIDSNPGRISTDSLKRKKKKK